MWIGDFGRDTAVTGPLRIKSRSILAIRETSNCNELPSKMLPGSLRFSWVWEPLEAIYFRILAIIKKILRASHSLY